MRTNERATHRDRQYNRSEREQYYHYIIYRIDYSFERHAVVHAREIERIEGRSLDQWRLSKDDASSFPAALISNRSLNKFSQKNEPKCGID